MGAFSLRALVQVGLVVSILSGCASAGRTSRDDLAATPQSDSATVSQSGGAAAAQNGRLDAQTVTSDDIRRANGPGEPIETVLEGRVAGVSVLRTGNGISVRIRGYSSFMGSNEPLYVLDGIPITPGPAGALRGISPYDIQSIVVLKDPVDTALYGLRGANGVIVITTMRPRA